MDVLKTEPLRSYKYNTSVTVYHLDIALEQCEYIPTKGLHSYYVHNDNGSYTVFFGSYKEETRGRNIKHEQKRDKTINLRISGNDLKKIDARVSAGKKAGSTASRTDVLLSAFYFMERHLSKTKNVENLHVLAFKPEEIDILITGLGWYIDQELYDFGETKELYHKVAHLKYELEAL